MLLAGGAARADGELHIFNWGDYTNPKLIEKFQKQYNVKVTLDDYDFERDHAGEGARRRHRLRRRRALRLHGQDHDRGGHAGEDRARPDGELQERQSEVRRRLLGQRPPLHRALAVGHHRLRRRHREIQRRHQHARPDVRSAAGAAGPHQRARRHELPVQCRPALSQPAALQRQSGGPEEALRSPDDRKGDHGGLSTTTRSAR